MKKVLIICFDFYDKRKIGAVRPNGLAKYLPVFGWEPIILTTKSEHNANYPFKVISTDYEDINTKYKYILEKTGVCKKEKNPHHSQTSKRINTLIDPIIGLAKDFLLYPDANKGWFDVAIQAGARLLDEEKIDAMISTSAPIVCHSVANKFNTEYKIPWVADLRDLWTQNHVYPHNRLRKFFERRLELKTLSSADALSTVSQPLSERLKELHKGKEIYTILNAFDPDQINTGVPLTNKFSITYTGGLCNGAMDPKPLFDALQELSSSSEIDLRDIAVYFYGPNDDWLKEDIRMYGMNAIIKKHGQISREDSLNKQRESQLLLLLTWNDPNEDGIFTGKLFDYLSAKRPILSVGLSGGVVKELLEKTKAGTHATGVTEVKKEIKKAYTEFKTCGHVKYSGIPSEVNKYNQIEMARKFAEILDNISWK